VTTSPVRRRHRYWHDASASVDSAAYHRIHDRAESGIETAIQAYIANSAVPISSGTVASYLWTPRSRSDLSRPNLRQLWLAGATAADSIGSAGTSGQQFCERNERLEGILRTDQGSVGLKVRAGRLVSGKARRDSQE